MENELKPGRTPEKKAHPPDVELAGKLPRVVTEHSEQRGQFLRFPERTQDANVPTGSTVHERFVPVLDAIVPNQTIVPSEAASGEDVGPTFPIVVPDFINWDPQVVVPTPPLDTKDRRGRKKRPPFVPRAMELALARLALVTQRRNPVMVPLPVVGAALWGGDRSAWPKNWVRVLAPRDTVAHASDLTRQEKARRTREARAAGIAKCMACPSDCPLHGTSQHAHQPWTLGKSLGRVAQLQCGKNPDGSARFDLTNKYTRDEVEKLRRKLSADIANRQTFLRVARAEGDDRVGRFEGELREVKRQLKRVREGGRKVDGLRPVYLPALAFATSPRFGLTPIRQNLLVALTLELTRDARPNDRRDQAAVLVGGAAGNCTLLDAGTAYVGFNGNGAGARAWLRGHGYKPAAWMKKAAYPDGTPVGDFVGDLAALADIFGLVVTAYRKADGEWLNLDELKAEARTAEGRKRLAGCLVRVYTPADYLSRWRALFAKKLGFSSIPENPDELPGAGAVVLPESPAAIKTARQLAAWMRKEGLNDAQLAEQLGVSRPCIAQYRTGKRKMGKAFLDRLARYTGHSPSGVCNARVTPSGPGVTVTSPGVEEAVSETARISRG